MNFRVPPHKKLISSSTLDISGTGVAFSTQEEVKPRQELLMYLLLPVKETIEIHSKVIWVKKVKGGLLRSSGGYRVGVRIVDPIKFDEREFIRFYAEKLIEFFGRKKK